MPKLTFPEIKYSHGAKAFLIRIFRPDDAPFVSGSSAKDFIVISTIKTEGVRDLGR